MKNKSGDEASHISANWELAMYQIRWLNGNLIFQKNKTPTVFTNIQLSFLFCTIQDLSCFLVHKFLVLKSRTSLITAFFLQGKEAVHNVRRGLIRLKQTENSLYKKVNIKTQS